MAAFPISSKRAMLSPVTDQKQDGTIRSSVDVGPPIVRRRYTAVARNIDVPCVLTNAERITFETWFTSTINNGAISFTWTDPLSGSTVNMRFRDTKGPNWQQISGGVNTEWAATLQLEILA